MAIQLTEKEERALLAKLQDDETPALKGLRRALHRKYVYDERYPLRHRELVAERR